MAQVLINQTPPTLPPSNPTATPQPNPDYTKLPERKRQDLLVLNSLNSVYDTVVANVLTTNVMSSLLMADFYVNNLKMNSAILLLKVLYAGGDNRTKSNPFVNIFTDGPRFSYAGGAVVSYVLVDQSGKIVLSGTTRDFAGYKKLSDSPDYRIHNNLSVKKYQR
jgi:hypothetical protein